MSRELFLERVRNAVRSGDAYRPHVKDVIAKAADTPKDEMADRFLGEVASVGGEPLRFETIEKLRSGIAELLAASPCKSAVHWVDPVLERIGLPDLLTSAQVSSFDIRGLASRSRDEMRRIILEADVGFTSVDRSIVRSGSLLVSARFGRESFVSLLPKWHVAIVPASALVSTLSHALEQLGRDCQMDLPRAATVITGPSKSGDIELQLTTGVHGPGRWTVLLCDEL